MDCPKCGGETRVTCLTHHPFLNRQRRFRRCLVCEHKFRTTQDAERLDDDGRHWKRLNSQAGERSVSAVLTEEDVRDLRNEYDRKTTTQEKLALRYGISLSQVNRIVRRQSWAHVS